MLFSSSGLHNNCLSFLWKLDTEAHSGLLGSRHEAEVTFAPYVHITFVFKHPLFYETHTVLITENAQNDLFEREHHIVSV